MIFRQCIENKKRTSAGTSRGNKKAARCGFTLAELIVAIALLSIFGVIAARMFFVSDGLSKKTEQIDRAVVLAANIAEAWQGIPVEGTVQLSDSFSLAGFNPGIFVTDPTDGRIWQTYLDAQLQPAAAGQGEFQLTVKQEKTDIVDVWQLVILVEAIHQQVSTDKQEDADIIYELAASRYLPTEVAE